MSANLERMHVAVSRLSSRQRQQVYDFLLGAAAEHLPADKWAELLETSITIVTHGSQPPIAEKVGKDAAAGPDR